MQRRQENEQMNSVGTHLPRRERIPAPARVAGRTELRANANKFALRCLHSCIPTATGLRPCAMAVAGLRCGYPVAPGPRRQPAKVVDTRDGSREGTPSIMTTQNSALHDVSFFSSAVKHLVRSMDAGEFIGPASSGHPAYGRGAALRDRSSLHRAREWSQCRTRA